MSNPWDFWKDLSRQRQDDPSRNRPPSGSVCEQSSWGGLKQCRQEATFLCMVCRAPLCNTHVGGTYEEGLNGCVGNHARPKPSGFVGPYDTCQWPGCGIVKDTSCWYCDARLCQWHSYRDWRDHRSCQSDSHVGHVFR